MSLFQSISDFFELVFKHSSPEAQKKQQLKKMEANLKIYPTVLYKNGNLLPNFGEAIFQLYRNCRPLDDLFLLTVSPLNIPRQKRFESQLILTGYSPAEQEIVESLTYEFRKRAVLEATDSKRVYETQHKNLETVIKALNSDTFRNMDKEILDLRQFVEFCHFNFLPILQVLDPNFQPGNPAYTPVYHEVSAARLANALEDLYFQMYSFTLSNAVGNAVIALAQMINGGNLSDEKAAAYTSNMKKIAYITKRIFTPDHLKAIIQLAKQDFSFQPKIAQITGSPRLEFSNAFQAQFKADENRIKTEVQDAIIVEELSNLFDGTNMVEVEHYDNNANSLIQENSPLSFQWILPMKILKNFFLTYINENTKTLLNDIVIEGFFTNQNYKSTFSSAVYSAIAGMEQIEAFEKSFGQGQKNSIAVLEGYLKDSHKDQSFYKKMEIMVSDINNDAKKLIQDETSNLFVLYRCLGDLMQDAKKPSSEIIENLKVLMMSSRNKENTSFLERSYPTWKIFFDIMKNYAILSTGDMNN